MSNSFPVQIAVKQGCILSPVLFSLYINELVEYLLLGVYVAGINVKILLYADDIVLLAESPNDLQVMINKLLTYCLTWSLKVNMSKSKLMVFRTGKLPSNLSFKYGSRCRNR